MGFNGGGGGQLLNHEHDGTLVADGGPLDFLGITQSGMSNGSICFSNTAHLRELSVGNIGDKLQVSAGNIPEWSPTMTSLSTQQSIQSGIFTTASTTFVAVGNGMSLVLPVVANGKALIICTYTSKNTGANNTYVTLMDDGVSNGIYQANEGADDSGSAIAGIFDLDGSTIALFCRCTAGSSSIIQSPAAVAGSICALQIA